MNYHNDVPINPTAEEQAEIMRKKWEHISNAPEPESLIHQPGKNIFKQVKQFEKSDPRYQHSLSDMRGLNSGQGFKRTDPKSYKQYPLMRPDESCVKQNVWYGAVPYIPNIDILDDMPALNIMDPNKVMLSDALKDDINVDKTVCNNLREKSTRYRQIRADKLMSTRTGAYRMAVEEYRARAPFAPKVVELSKHRTRPPQRNALEEILKAQQQLAYRNIANLPKPPAPGPIPVPPPP